MQIKGTASPTAAGSGEEGGSGFTYNKGSYVMGTAFLLLLLRVVTADSLNVPTIIIMWTCDLQTKCRLHAPPSLPVLYAGAHLPISPSSALLSICKKFIQLNNYRRVYTKQDSGQMLQQPGN